MTDAIQTLEIGGDRFTMGRELGRAAGQFMHSQLATSGRWQTVQAQRASEQVRAMEQAARRTFPRAVREIEGLAAGADMPFDQVFAWHCHYELRVMDSPPPAAGIEGEPAQECTTLVWPAEDGVVMAHNEDGMALYYGQCLWVRAWPDEGLAYSGFHYPGLTCGNCFFANSAGIVHATNHIPDPPAAGGVPRQIVLRAVVDCASLDELAALLRRTRRASGCHHTAAQVGGGPALSIEAPAAAVSVQRLTAAYAHSNHLIHPALAGAGQPGSASSQARLDRARTLLARLPDQAGKEDLLAILADGQNQDLPIYMERVDGPEDTRTVAAATFEVSQAAVRWAVHGSPAGPALLQGEAEGSTAG